MSMAMITNCENCREICAEHRQLLASLPHFLQWSSFSIEGAGAMSSTADFMSNMHLEFLNNEFILYHALVKRTGQGKTEFLNLAREMLSLLLVTLARCPFPRRESLQTWNVSLLLSSCAGSFFFPFPHLLHKFPDYS